MVHYFEPSYLERCVPRRNEIREWYCSLMTNLGHVELLRYSCRSLKQPLTQSLIMAWEKVLAPVQHIFFLSPPQNWPVKKKYFGASD